MRHPDWQRIVTGLGRHAREADATPAWPEESWQLVRESGALGWCIPAEYGGQGRTGPEILEGYETLASGCLTTCFLLSQRDAAIRRLRDFGSEAVCRNLLPPLARGDTFTTVGLSQLTTSRQHGAPVLAAHATTDGFVLTGVIPWVSGAARADNFVLGATLDDGRQFLAVVPRTTAGLTVGPPLDLMALQGSLTAEIHCDGVLIPRDQLLAGPVEKVMASGRGGTGGLETTCLALGLTRAALDYLQTESSARSELRPITERLTRGYTTTREEMFRLAEAGVTAEKAAQLRAAGNALVVRATQTALTAAKGTGFLRSHPAQRWARQALFFLVWSCPRPAVEATLDLLMPCEVM